MKKVFILGLLALFVAGCSRQHLAAKIYIYQGEQNHYKAYQLKVKKNATEERKKYYRKACDQFVKAYDLEPPLFNFYQASYAYESCKWVDDNENAEKFAILLESLNEPSFGPDGGPGLMAE